MVGRNKCYSRLIPLKLILKEEYRPLIEEKIITSNEIVREAYQFLKAFFLNCCEHDLELPEINRSFLKGVFSLITNKRGGKRPNPEILNKITPFYDKHYSKLQIEKHNNPGKDILDEEIIQMETGIENHIKVHFYDYIKRLTFSHIPKTNGNYRKDRPKLVKDLFNHTFNSPEEYHDLIREFAPEIVQARETRYSKPQNCLKLLYKINCKLQENDQKTFAWLPLRKTLIPCSIQLSKTICKEIFKIHSVWDDICKNVRKHFEPKDRYKFSSLRTNGVSCSLVFTSKIRIDDKEEEQYLNDLSEDELYALRDFNLLAGDPNKGNLVQLQDENGVLLRYTATQRRRETHSGRYRSLCLKRQREAWGIAQQDEESITLGNNLESLKEVNSRGTSLEKFLEYVKEKNLMAQRFREHYTQYYHRKFAFNTKINSKRSKDKFLNRLEQTYGSPSSTVLCIGDWEQSQGISFGKAPTMGCGIRNWFRQRGYRVYLVNECRTSITCCKCKSENEYNWLKRKDPRPWKDELQKVWGLSRCINSQCRVIHNRDVNSSSNILEISRSLVDGGDRPQYFRRNYRSRALIQGS
jgi:hypothetical protein